MDGVDGVLASDWTRAVDGEVSEFLDGTALLEDGLPDETPKCWLVNEGTEIVTIGKGEGIVVFVDPSDEEFEGTSGVKTRGAWVIIRETFCTSAGGIYFLEL